MNINTIEIMREEIAKRKSTDKGATGKAFEIAVRWFAQPRSKRNGAVTRQYTTYGDMRKRNSDGHYFSIEIKTGSGELADGCATIDEIYPKASHVIYCPEVELGIPAEKQGFVFTRNEFIQMLKSYPGRGQLIRTKTNTQGATKVTLQSFRTKTQPKASQPIADYLWDCCYNQPTVEQFFGEAQLPQFYQQSSNQCE